MRVPGLIHLEIVYRPGGLQNVIETDSAVRASLLERRRAFEQRLTLAPPTLRTATLDSLAALLEDDGHYTIFAEYVCDLFKIFDGVPLSLVMVPPATRLYLKTRT